jgi:hypothetical protein
VRRALLVLLVMTATARADVTDYDPNSQQWNGMASFIGLAEGIGYSVTSVAELEWDKLGDQDILFLVYPLQRVDPARLGRFVQAGGNVVIADDFGEGKDGMAGLGLLRAEVSAPRAASYYANQPFAPIATARGDHPIAREVNANKEHGVVTNHPAALEQVQGATVVVSFEDGAVVAAGERGTGRFVAVSDPSIFINRMLQFGGNVQLTSNILDWLSRGHQSRHIVLLRGDTSMFGDPKPFIYDPRGGTVGRTVADLNSWLGAAEEWLLTPAAMKGLAAALAALLLGLALGALPVRRGPNIDGAWLRFSRPARRDEPHALVTGADRGGSLLVLACILRDQVQGLLADALAGSREPLYTMPENELVARLAAARGATASVALARVYKRLRALPSRGQAAAPWSSGHLPRREFDALYRDVAELCRTLGSALTEVPNEA